MKLEIKCKVQVTKMRWETLLNVITQSIKICQGVFSVLKFFSGMAVSDSTRVGTRNAPTPKSDQYLFFMMRKVSGRMLLMRLGRRKGMEGPV